MTTTVLDRSRYIVTISIEMMRHGWGWRSRHDDEVHAADRGRGRGPRGPGRGGRGGWGGGPPWGNDGPPWQNLAALFGRGQRARRGDVRAAILVLLDEEPRNGYQLMQELERRSQGNWRPSSGSVYPTLQQLEDEGLVVASKDDSNRVFKLSERGKSYVAKNKDELGTPWETEANAGGGDVRWEVMNQFRELGPALAQVVRFGTPAQVTEAKRIVVEARRALYRLLADGTEDDE